MTRPERPTIRDVARAAGGVQGHRLVRAQRAAGRRRRAPGGASSTPPRDARLAAEPPGPLAVRLPGVRARPGPRAAARAARRRPVLPRLHRRASRRVLVRRAARPWCCRSCPTASRGAPATGGWPATGGSTGCSSPTCASTDPRIALLERARSARRHPQPPRRAEPVPRRLLSTTGRASPPPSRTSSSSGTAASPTSPARPSSCTRSVAGEAWGEALAAAGLSAGPRRRRPTSPPPAGAARHARPARTRTTGRPRSSTPTT